ncbi:hypothetical protein P3S68_025816 [Capsicum galapagoense]
MVKWAELPNDLIALIAKHIKVIEDFIAFCNVCKSWKIVATKENFNLFSAQVPLLMLADKNDDHREFYSLSKQKGRGDQVIIDNAIFFASPLTSDYVRLVSYYGGGGNRLAFWRPGNLNWTNIIAEWGEITNISYFKGQFYSVSWSGRVWVIDVIGPKLIKPCLLVQLEDDMWREHHTIQLYLVELCGALLLVIRFANCDDIAYPEGEFKEETKTLGESAIFLGRNRPITIDSSKVTGVKSNHIYFTDDWSEQFNALEGRGGRDTGTYNLEDGKIEAIYLGLSLSPICPPTWITPSLC